MTDLLTCPTCGVELPAGAPRKLCPRCLFRAGLEEDRLPSATADHLAGGSVLAAIAETTGAVPRILLRDTDPGEPPGPIVRPAAKVDAGGSMRYRVDGEIDRGGMGAVLKGRDPDLGRDVALKVLREDHRDKPEMVHRFIEEAQIGGQLQHPGIVPVYELGVFPDHRPFFAMKLVKGSTLSSLLGARRSPADGLARLLSVFEQVSQTVAYAHARGVIHRDLKPLNVMTGAFGEVQVMDWGLAKVLPRHRETNGAAEPARPPHETVVATARSDSDGDQSLAGSVLGTPGYMAPEQARGETSLLDERCDVFALGSILCELLTGSPAFTGRTSGELQRKAARGDLADAFTRLSECGADPDLVALARDCLAPEREDRPRTAGVVAARMTAYLASVQERLRRAELERVEERGRRRLTTVAAAAIVLLGLAGAGTYTWIQHQRAERLTRAERAIGTALAEAERLRGEALAAPPGGPDRWSDALAAVGRAEGLAAQGDADPQLTRRVADLRGRIEHGRDDAAARARALAIDHTLLAELDAIRGRLVEERNFARADADYAAAFLKAGLDLDAIEPGEAGRWLAARSQPVELISYLDSWTNARISSHRPEADWRRLVAAARAADPDPWRNALRARIGSRDDKTAAELRRLADDTKALDAQPAPSLNLLAVLLLQAANDPERAARVLERAVLRHPSDFLSHVNLAHIRGNDTGYMRDTFPKPEEAERHLTAAVALRPDSRAARASLATVLLLLGKQAEAREVLRQASQIGPDDTQVRMIRWHLFMMEQKYDEALAVIREVVGREPEVAVHHFSLGQTLMAQHKYAEALEAHRQAARLDPRVPMYHNNVGLDLYLMGKPDEAVAAMRKAIEIRPEWAVAHNNLGLFLANQGKNREALAALRETVRLDPDFHTAQAMIGDVLLREADYQGAIAAYRKADAIVRKQPAEMHGSFPRGWTDKIERAERLAGLAPRLPALLKGEDHARDQAERLELAQLCYDTKRFAAAARFWGEALATNPKSGEDRVAQIGYNAACAAALAAAGQGVDPPTGNAAARTALRAQALGWLRAERDAWARAAAGTPQARAGAIAALRHWKADSDLSGVRDRAALEQLPEAERKEWQALWSDVDAALAGGR